MHTRDPKGVPRDIEGTVTPSGERRVELRPETIDGKPATGRDSQPFGFTLSTDGKTLQALGLVLERQ